MNHDEEKKLRDMHWRDRYEYEAQRETAALERMNEQELLARIRSKNIDIYFAIWRAIGQKGTIENAAMVLFDFLQQSPGDKQTLNRYHCAAALFNILNMPDPASDNPLRKQVQWDHHGEEARQEALANLKLIIEEKRGGVPGAA